MSFAERILGFFVSKKRVIKYLSALGLALGALMAGMQTQEFKDAVCSAPVLDIPQAEETAAP